MAAKIHDHPIKILRTIKKSAIKKDKFNFGEAPKITYADNDNKIYWIDFHCNLYNDSNSLKFRGLTKKYKEDKYSRNQLTELYQIRVVPI
jgi:hypothetical protein